MTGIRITNQTANAMLTQMVRGGKAEINVLLGEMATMPISPVDGESMRKRIEEVLGGMHPETTASCVRHLGAMHSCAMDVALMHGIGLEPAVVCYIVASMGSLELRTDDCSINFSQGPARLHFDLPLGAHAIWTAAHEHSLYLDNLPETVVSVLNGRIADGHGRLTDVLRHPFLDTYDLMMRDARTLSSGAVIITIADHPAVTDQRMDEILEGKMA